MSSNAYKAITFAAWTFRAEENFDDVFERDCQDPSDSLTCAILADPFFAATRSPEAAGSEQSTQRELPGDAASEDEPVPTDWFDQADPLADIAQEFPVSDAGTLLEVQLEAVSGALEHQSSGDRQAALTALQEGAQAASGFLDLIGNAYGIVRSSAQDAPPRADVCHELGDPTTNEEFRELKSCDPDRLYCPKGPEDDGVIMGTSGDDVLVGSERPEIICGMGGNDVIIGNGGAPKDQKWIATDEVWEPDRLYGGPGDDMLTGSSRTDIIQGNDGDDVLLGKNNCYELLDVRIECADHLYGDSHVVLGPKPKNDTGDDVLIGGPITSRDILSGGGGDDLLVASPFPLSWSGIAAGDGNDVAVTLNFSPVPSTIRLKKQENIKLSVPLSACTVTTQLDTRDPEGGVSGAVSCSLPWPGSLSGLDKIIPLSASLNTDGKVSFDATLHNQLGSMSLSTLDEMVSFQASLNDDVCICDPLRGSPPTTLAELGLPWDHYLG
jgi:hypothetical protein